MKRFIITVLSALVVLFAAAIAADDKAGELKLQQAIDLIESKGDLAKAAPLLESVAMSPDRALAARGLLCLARAQERYGQADAQKTYARLVNDFADQPTVVAEARAALAGAGAQTQLTTRLLWQGLQWQAAAISPDGSAVAFIDALRGDLGVRNITTGASKMLAQGPADKPWTQFALDPVWSPDGRRIAYNWYGDDGTPEGFDEIRIADVSSGRIASVAGTKNAGMTIADWNPDGQRLLITARKSSGSNVFNFHWIRSADGTREPIDLRFDPETTKSIGPLEGVGSASGAVAPDGRQIAFAIRGGIFIVPTGGGVATKIVDGNMVVGWTADGLLVFYASPSIKSLRLNNGVPVDAPSSLPVDSLSPGNAPGLHSLSRTGRLLVTRRTGGDPELLFSHRNPGSSSWSQGEPMPHGPGRVGVPLAWSPDGQRLLYGLSGEGKNLLGLAGGDGKTIRIVPSVGLAPAMSLAWSTPNQVLVLATQSRTVDGRPQMERAYYRLNLDTGDAAVATTPQQFPQGLPAGDLVSFVGVSPDGRTTYRRTNYRPSGLVSVSAVDETTGAARELFRSEQRAGLFAGPVSRDGRWLPIFVNDPAHRQLLLVPTAVGTPRAVCDLPEIAGVIAWSADETSILFVQGRGIAEHQVDEILECAVSGGNRRSLGIQAPRISDIAPHPDGTRIAYIAAPRPTSDVLILENFLPKGGPAQR